MKKINIHGIAALLGCIAFVLIYGIRILNPFYTDWLLAGGDPSQHYLGWEFYRRSQWLWPLGMTDQMAYPLETSVIYTDSIPIFAVLFKLFRRLIPTKFQYFGIWGVCCFILQGYFASKILAQKITSKIIVIIGSIFFIISPIMIFRMYYHTALATHWLILVSIYFYGNHEADYLYSCRASIQWGVLGILIASIHLYFVPMCGAILIGYILCSFWKAKRFKLRFLYPGVSFSIGLLLTVYLLGGFSSSATAGTNSLGLFSFNLNAFLNPMSYSTILKNTSLWNWPFYTQGQYEGFAYLGLGTILLCICGMIVMIKRMIDGTRISVYQVMLVLMSVGLVLMAVSPTITWNDKLVLQLPYSSTLYKYWGIFGSCGRMAWPIVYFFMIFGMTTVGKLADWDRKLAYVILGIACLIQILDLSEQLVRRHDDYSVDFAYTSPLEETIWDKIAAEDRYEHIVWVSHNVDHSDVIQVAIFALNHDMTMGNFYFARDIDNRKLIETQLENIAKENVYVFLKKDDTFEYEKYDNYKEVLNFYPCGEYMIGTVDKLQ